MKTQKPLKSHNKELLNVEIIIGLISSIALIIIVAVSATLIATQPATAITIISVAIAAFIIICLALTKMEQIVGYYQCANCRHKYIPSYQAVLWSMHLGRTRYLTCPKCHKKSWQKKVL